MKALILTADQLERVKNGAPVSAIVGKSRQRQPGDWAQGIPGTRGLRFSQKYANIPPQQKRPLPCINLGAIVTYCPFGDPLRHVHYCEHFDENCTRGPSGARSCENCEAYDHGGTVQFPVRFDEHGLFPQIGGRRFNPSIIEDKGGYVFCFRTGWAGSEVVMVRLDKDFTPFGSPVRLYLNTFASDYGREDPRLFRFRGQLHVSFIGVQGTGWRNGIVTNQLYARLNDDLSVERIFYPQIPGRQGWEKNHVYFEHDGELYAIYSIAPHRIARVRGDSWEWLHETPFTGQWSGGHMRGGSAPMLVGDEWYCFFHGCIQGPRDRTYNVGVYTFENKPPFRILRYTPNPLLWASWEEKDREWPSQYCAVVFPGGAVQQGDKWIVACGEHDRCCKLRAWAAADIEGALKPL